MGDILNLVSFAMALLILCSEYKNKMMINTLKISNESIPFYDNEINKSYLPQTKQNPSNWQQNRKGKKIKFGFLSELYLLPIV